MSTNETSGVRTLAEVRDGRVTVTITIDTQESSQDRYAEASTVRQLTDELDESRAVIEKMRVTLQKSRELETALQESRELVEFKNQVIDDLDAERNRLAKRAREARDAINGRDLAIGELALVRDRFAELKALLKDRDRTLSAVRDAVNDGHVDDILEQSMTKVSEKLSRIIRNVRSIVSSSPSTGTSQA